jgi:hypothetical protein
VPIKWNALKVSESMDEVDTHLNKIIEPLKAAKSSVEVVLLIPNLPEYIQQPLRTLGSNIDSDIGYIASWDKKWRPGRLQSEVQRIRDLLPKDALVAEKEKLRQGTKQSML